MNDLSAPRETGVAKSSTSCPTCGEELPLVVSPYGSTTSGACTRCWTLVVDPLAAQIAAAQGAALDEQLATE